MKKVAFKRKVSFFIEMKNILSIIWRATVYERKSPRNKSVAHHFITFFQQNVYFNSKRRNDV